MASDSLTSATTEASTSDTSKATGAGPMVAPPGLKGLIVADTRVGTVRGQEGFFHYRQYDATQVARHRQFEAAAALLIDGELPDLEAESAFRAELAVARHLSPGTQTWLRALAATHASPLSGLMAAVPLLVGDVPLLDLSEEERRSHAIRIAGAVPAVLAGLHRLNLGHDPLAADPSLGHAADYVRMATGTTPPSRVVRAIETYLSLTADHGFNASTFTARVVASTGASVAAALTAAIGALSGPLHGGAPSRVLDMLDEIGEPANTRTWATAQLKAGHKIMGFGHAVYRSDDPRSQLLREVALDLGGPLVERAVEIESEMLAALRRWKPGAQIVTNVEFYAAVVMDMAGLPQEMFTPTFTTSRVFGWCAHLLEQAADGKIMRPAARYVGPTPGPVLPV